MSRIPLAAAAPVALELVQLLEPFCDRIAVAGSIRRRVSDVKDIEIVATPRIDDVAAGDLWGAETRREDRLMQRVNGLLADGRLALRDVEVHRKDGTVEYQHRFGDAYQALVFDGIPVDLFIVRPPAEWGVIFAIRTGPGDWNQRLVTECQRYFLRVQDGQVWHLGKSIACPEERDFFAALGQPWVDPAARHPSRVRLERRQVEATA